MKDDNKSLIHSSSSSLVKTGNLIKLTEKILEISKLDVRVNLIPYRKGNIFQIYDYKTKFLDQNIFDKAYYLDKTLTFSKSCIIEMNKKYSIINKLDDLENTTWYNSIKLLKSNNYFNLSIVSLGNIFGIIDDKNNVILPIGYDEIETFYYNSNTFVKLKKNKYFGLFLLEKM